MNDRVNTEITEGRTIQTVGEGGMLHYPPEKLGLDVYPFGHWDEVVNFWLDGVTPQKQTRVEWVFGEDMANIAEIAEEVGAKNIRKDQKNSAHPEFVKTKGTGVAPVGWQLESWEQVGGAEHTTQAALWRKVYRRAWNEAEEELHRYIRRGVPNAAMMERFKRAEKTIIPALRDKFDEIPEARFRVKVTDDGEEPEIDRYLDCETEMWIRPERMKARKRAVTLAVNMVANSNRTPEFFADLFVGVTVISNYLVKHGYEVRLLGVRLPVFNRMSENKAIRGYTFPLVEFGQRFDPVRLLTWATPGVVRYFGFGWCDAIHGDMQGDEIARKIAENGGAGAESRLGQDTVKKLGIDWLVTARGGWNFAAELVTEAGEVFDTLWK
jgi:hypothetical protein